MLGFYENFPTDIHKIARFHTSTPKTSLQKALAQTLYEFNKENFNLADVAYPSVPQCTVIFEVGIAEANSFNYMDKKETTRMLKMIRKNPFKVMDFFCAIRYYKTQNNNKNPLKFDYYMLRFIFDTETTEVRVFHERGPRHVSPKEIINFFSHKINEKFSTEILRASRTF